MDKSFQIIADFIREIYGFDFLKEPMERKFSRIRELKNAHDTIVRIIRDQRKPFSEEFVRYVYPLLEVSFQWYELKKSGQITEKFLTKCKTRVKQPRQETFYGTIFELDMASRCLLSGWDIEFVEDYTEEGRQIDFVIYRDSGHGKADGVDCLSKRYTENLTIDKINHNIHIHARKFEPEHIDKLGIPLAKKLLILDITKEDYSPPEVRDDLGNIRISSKLDAVVFTWREDIVNGDNHSLKVRYKNIGDIDYRYFSTTYAAEFRKGPVFFIRKYIEPEPRVSFIGPEERAKE